MGDPRYFSPAVKQRWFNTSFSKKSILGAILCVFVGLAMWLVPFSVRGATIFEDNFNSYDEGALNGQGDWVGVSGKTSFDVISTPIYEGLRAVKSGLVADHDFGNIGYGDAVASGTISVAMKFNNATPFTGTNWFDFNIGSPHWFGFDGLYQGEPAGVNYYCGGIVCFTDTAPYIWHIFRLEWWQGTNEVWGDWYVDGNLVRTLAVADVNQDYDRVDFGAYPQTSFYADYISESGAGACVLGSCENCSFYESCIRADCFWAHSSYPLIVEDQCIEPPTPAPEYCGSFFSCQYCLTEETCEAELCAWADIGFGNKCYMPTPIIPPAEGEWEAPALEDCGGLTGVEKWLCEIKNFIAGIFMPTQAKVEEFYMTIGAFSEKFPFNYANSLRAFFTDLKNSFDTEKTIPVKILGAEGNVDFTFWSASTTIGGTSEDLGNVVKDFSTFIILLGLTLWLISFIKRFL